MSPERAGGCHVEGLGRGGIVAMALAQGQTKAQVTRVEYHPFNSITLSDAEFLTGKKEGRPVTLAGELRRNSPAWR
jgi:hypothetical protein